jgi:hypothetical protein
LDCRGLPRRILPPAGLPKIAGKGIDRWVGFDQIQRVMTILVGCCEVADAVGLLVPILAVRATWMTPLAALGICVISLMASGFTYAIASGWQRWKPPCGHCSAALSRPPAGGNSRPDRPAPIPVCSGRC